LSLLSAPLDPILNRISSAFHARARRAPAADFEIDSFVLRAGHPLSYKLFSVEAE
jgi:hypothetical protein